MWHVAWTIWAGLGLVMEGVGLKVGAPLTRTVRVYLLGGAAGSAAVGAFLAWLAWHWLVVASGVGPGDLIAVAVGAAVGLAGWAYRLGRGDGMLERLRFVASWAWPFIWPLIRKFLTEEGKRLADAAREAVYLAEMTGLPGDEKKAQARQMIREYLSGFGDAWRTRDIDDAIQAALRHIGPVDP